MRITRSITPVILLSLFISCNNSGKQSETGKDTTGNTDTTVRVDPVMIPPADTLSNSFVYLRSYAGKYPSEVKLLEDSILRPRLQKLLGRRFDFFVNTWAVETPMEVRNNLFVASACMAHNCGSTNFIIVVDLSKDVLYAGIREDDKVTRYAEDGGGNSELENWATGN